MHDPKSTKTWVKHTFFNLVLVLFLVLHPLLLVLLLPSLSLRWLSLMPAGDASVPTAGQRTSLHPKQQPLTWLVSEQGTQNNSTRRQHVPVSLELKASEKRLVFGNDWKVSVVPAVFICKGKLFYYLGAAIENARSPLLLSLALETFRTIY